MDCRTHQANLSQSSEPCLYEQLGCHNYRWREPRRKPFRKSIPGSSSENTRSPAAATTTTAFLSLMIVRRALFSLYYTRALACETNNNNLLITDNTPDIVFWGTQLLTSDAEAGRDCNLRQLQQSKTSNLRRPIAAAAEGRAPPRYRRTSHAHNLHFLLEMIISYFFLFLQEV